MKQLSYVYRFKSSNAEQNNEKIPNSFGESNEDGLTTAQRGTADTVVNTPQKSQSTTTTSQDGSESSHNHLITELQKCIGGSNRGALQLLEQLKKSLMAGRCSNIHLNPERIRNSP
ncbi:unnamed protein product [Anisakis simplex]|uniref:Uncharacterized protein n=1 Tax=Anisakis simplex TaxID=6269 RepID=A0A3P6SB09_ANISI|nr:unnamed protein product [Anisakis simplex]